MLAEAVLKGNYCWNIKEKHLIEIPEIVLPFEKQ